MRTQLLGEAQDVFTADDQVTNYAILKAALLTAFEVVPETYRTRCRTLQKNANETYGDFAYKMSIHFKRWLSSVEAFDHVTVMREYI